MTGTCTSTLNLCRVFQGMNDLVYCVIKFDENLPRFGKGSDLDIFCFDLPAVVRRIISLLGDQIGSNLMLDVNSSAQYTKIDVKGVRNEDLIYRFDLYGVLPPYRNVALRPALFESIIEGRIEHEIGQGEQRCTIFVPAAVDDLLIRYVEYHEWYAERPDKIKHMEYLLKQSSSDRQLFLSKLHHYVRLPEISAGSNPTLKCGQVLKACAASLRLNKPIRLVKLAVGFIRKWVDRKMRLFH